MREVLVKGLYFAFSSDPRAFPRNATTIASVVRRTAGRVWVKFYCRGFLAESFESGRLRVDFLAADAGERAGRYPWHVTPAVFDRLQVIRDAEEWDRCLVMDYDEVALCDLAPLFGMDLGDKLLAARMHGPGVDLEYAMKHYRRNESIPAGWKHTAKHPYFCMGPLMNLAEMRRAGTWEKLVAAHEAFRAEEQIALTAATDGRTMGFEPKWNLFPGTDLNGEDVPEGVIHWTGPRKPWHPGKGIWRPEIWESEECSWEALRRGWWEKPLAVEVDPADWESVNGLARRGWKVVAILSPGHEPKSEEAPADPGGPKTKFKLCGHCGQTHAKPDDEINPDAKWKRQLPFPDLKVLRLADGEGDLAALAAGADRVRFGPGAEVGGWLGMGEALPRAIVVQGPAGPEAMQAVRRAGYGTVTTLRRADWPAGGPAAAAFDGRSESVPAEVPESVDACFRLAGR